MFNTGTGFRPTFSTFGSILEDIDIDVYDNHAYAYYEWVKVLMKFNRLALSPCTFEEGATIEEMGDSCCEKYRGYKFQVVLGLLIQFLLDNKIQVRNPEFILNLKNS